MEINVSEISMAAPYLVYGCILLIILIAFGYKVYSNLIIFNKKHKIFSWINLKLDNSLLDDDEEN